MNTRAPRRALRLVSFLCACLVVAACSKDAARKIARHHRDAGGQDEGDATTPDDVDAAVGGDASSAGEGGSAAAGSGGRASSGASGGGAGTGSGGTGGGDAGPSDVDPTSCDVPEETNVFTTDLHTAADDGRVSVALGVTGFGAAWNAPGCGVVQAMPLQALGEFGTATTLFKDCKTIRDLALVHAAQGWRMVWIDNSTGSSELQTTLITEAMTGKVGDVLRTRLTTNALQERRPVLAEVGGSPLLAYIATDTVTGSARIISQRLDSEPSEAREVLPESAGHKPLALALIQIGDEDGALAWAADEGKHGIWVQHTDLEGAPIDGPTLLTEANSGGSSLDLAARDENEGGAVLYSLAVGGANQEVRFRRLDRLAGLIGDEKKIVGQPLQGRDASFARLGGGYVVAYRALPGGAIKAPELRVAFVTKEGNIMRDAQGTLVSYKIADASSGGGRTTIRRSTDGQLVIGIVDVEGSTKKLRLIRKRLDCAF